MGGAPRSRVAVLGPGVRSPAVAVAIVVFALCAGGLMLTHRAQRGPLSPAAAIQATRSGHALLHMSPKLRWTAVKASPLDGRLERVDYYDGPQIVAEFAVDRRGRIIQRDQYAGEAVPYGDTIAYQPAVLAGLALLFALMTAVVPLRRIQNADVGAVLSLLAPVVLLQHRYLAASVLAALPGLGYLLARCMWVALRPERRGQDTVATPIFDRLTANLAATEPARILWILLGALVLVFVMVGISSPRAVDVVYAVMEGATKILHGVIPYGHLPGDVVHGDTYPILSYIAYLPVARLAPVRSTWDSVDAALAYGVLAALAGAGAVCGLARRLRPSTGFGTAPLRAAIAWLSFPALLIAVSSGTTDVLLATLVVFALLLRGRAFASSGTLAAAGWFKLAPFALLPIWLAPLRGARLARALAGVAALSAAMVAVVLALGGPAGLSAMVRAVSFQTSRGSPQSLWVALGIGGLQPLGQAAVAALIAGTTVHFAARPRLASDIRLAAASAAVLIAMQLATNYWSFLYTAWFAPLLCVSLLLAPSPALGRVMRPDAQPQPERAAIAV